MIVVVNQEALICEPLLKYHLHLQMNLLHICILLMKLECVRLSLYHGRCHDSSTGGLIRGQGDKKGQSKGSNLRPPLFKMSVSEEGMISRAYHQVMRDRWPYLRTPLTYRNALRDLCVQWSSCNNDWSVQR